MAVFYAASLFQPLQFLRFWIELMCYFRTFGRTEFYYMQLMLLLQKPFLKIIPISSSKQQDDIQTLNQNVERSFVYFSICAFEQYAPQVHPSRAIMKTYWASLRIRGLIAFRRRTNGVILGRSNVYIHGFAKRLV